MQSLDTKELVRKYGFRFQKALGQNFLTDPQVVADIIEGSAITKEDHVLEIGPGVGSLTRSLLAAAGQVTAIEIDDALIPILETEIKEDHFRLIHGDVLKVDLKALAGDKPFKVVANLPYYVTTPILLALLQDDFPWESLTLMIQKEVADRLAAKPGTKDYGSLTLLVDYHARVTPIRIVKPHSFLPPPKVDSAVIRLDRRREKAIRPKDEALFLRLIRQAFAMRRKTLRNNLKDLGYPQDQLAAAYETAAIDPSRRGETLTIEEFATLSDALSQGGSHEEQI